jgi:hypothetical protein
MKTRNIVDIKLKNIPKGNKSLQAIANDSTNSRVTKFHI